MTTLEQTALLGSLEVRRRLSSHTLESLGLICDRPFFRVFKELIDLMFVSVVMLFFLPVVPLIAILIKIDSRGPVFYLQKRLGVNGEVFYMYKFRTMIADAERDTGPVWSNDHDPRITRVGHWLRKLYIDELPQCFNILARQMSLVGPRPERPELTTVFEHVVQGFSNRTVVKPGITGLAQVSRIYKMIPGDLRNKLRYDLFYIRKQCCVLDIKILLRTLRFWVNSCVR